MKHPGATPHKVLSQPQTPQKIATRTKRLLDPSTRFGRLTNRAQGPYTVNEFVESAQNIIIVLQFFADKSFHPQQDAPDIRPA